LSVQEQVPDLTTAERGESCFVGLHGLVLHRTVDLTSTCDSLAVTPVLALLSELTSTVISFELGHA